MTGEDRAETLAVAQQQGDSLHLERAGERFENLLDRLRQVPVGDMAQTRKDQLAQAQALQLVLLAVGLPVEVGDVHAQQQRASQAVERLHRLETTGQWRGGIAAQRQVETLAPAQAGQRRRTGARRSRYSAKGRGCSPSPWAHCRRYACRPPTRITRSCSSISKHRSQLLSEALQREGPSCEKGSGLSASADDEREKFEHATTSQQQVGTRLQRLRQVGNRADAGEAQHGDDRLARIAVRVLHADLDPRRGADVVGVLAVTGTRLEVRSPGRRHPVQACEQLVPGTGFGEALVARIGGIDSDRRTGPTAAASLNDCNMSKGML